MHYTCGAASVSVDLGGASLPVKNALHVWQCQCLRRPQGNEKPSPARFRRQPQQQHLGLSLPSINEILNTAHGNHPISRPTLSSLFLSALLFPHSSFFLSFLFFFLFLIRRIPFARTVTLTALAVCLSYTDVFFFPEENVVSASGHSSLRDGNTTQYADQLHHNIEREKEIDRQRNGRRENLVGKQLIASKLNFPLYCTATETREYGTV